MKRSAKVFLSVLALKLIISLVLIGTHVDIDKKFISDYMRDPVGTLASLVKPTPSPTPILGVQDAQNSEQAVVSKIIDGDTIELSDGRKLRYIGMDTPETHHPTKGAECFGKEATEKNRQLVEGKTITIQKDVSETDRYGRLLRYVWVDGIFVNKELVQTGYAVARSYPPDIAKQEELRQAESAARAQNLGLWRSCPAR